MGEGDGIDPEVEQRAAGQRRVVQPMGRGMVAHVLPVVGDDAHQIADLAARKDVAHDDHVRQEAGPHRLHHEHARCPGRVEDLRGLGCVDGERLLDQDVLAGGDGQQGVVEVLGVRGGDVDDLDVRIGDERLVAAVRAGDAVAGGELVGAFLGARPDRDHGRLRVPRDRLGEDAGDPAGAQDAPPKGGGGCGVGRGGGMGLGHPATVLPPASRRRTRASVARPRDDGRRSDLSPRPRIRTAIEGGPMGAPEVDAYMEGVPEPQRSTLAQVRATLEALLPDAEQTISYGSPTFKVGGKGVAGFAAFAHHCSYLPMSGGRHCRAGRRADRIRDHQRVGQVPRGRAASGTDPARPGRCPPGGAGPDPLRHGVPAAAPSASRTTGATRAERHVSRTGPAEHTGITGEEGDAP